LGDKQQTEKVAGNWTSTATGTLNQGFFEGFCDVAKVVIIQKII
jgi:hypothetical protein